MNLLLGNLASAEAITSSIHRNGAPLLSSTNTFGVYKTLSISDMVYLRKDQEYSTQVSSTQSGHLSGATLEGGYSIYFVRSSPMRKV